MAAARECRSLASAFARAARAPADRRTPPLSPPPSSPPPNAPFETLTLDVGDGHALYVERVGRPGGLPAIFLHGGPGSGAQPLHRTLFDPARFDAVLYDQRGAGRSTPWLGLRANTTAHLVADIEQIRMRFGFERVILVGGSWGSTLALAYAEAHPARVAGIVIRAVFLGTRREVEWAFLDGPARFRPELYERFVGWLPEAERRDPLAAYYRRLLSPDPAEQVPAAWMWHNYERALSEIQPARAALPAPSELRTTGKPPPTAVMEAHYLSQDCFLAPDQLVRDAGRLAGIPGAIVQGRYDLLCPPAAAHRLAAAWPDATLTILDTAGHAMTEPGIREAMVAGLARVAGG